MQFKSAIFSFLSLSLIFTNLQAQVKGGTESKLFDMYAFEKYEDCAFKAEAMTESSKHSKNPEPYLYLSMCYLQISKIDPDELDQEYKDPLKDALKYADKFRKKDKEDEMYNQNLDYFKDLKRAGIYRANQEYSEKGARKAAYYYKMILKFDEHDDNIRFMYGVSNLIALNSQGAMDVNEAVKGINEKYKNSAYVKDEISEPVLVDGFIKYTAFLLEKNQEDSAKATIRMAKDLLPENEDIVKEFNTVFGIKEEPKKESKNKDMNMVYEKHEVKVSKDSLKVIREQKEAQKEEQNQQLIENFNQKPQSKKEEPIDDGFDDGFGEEEFEEEEEE